MLMIYNKDRPGVIGTVGRVLGERNVNIARMQCARSKKGENALLIIGLDDSPSPQIIETLKQEEDILSVRLVDLTQVQ